MADDGKRSEPVSFKATERMLLDLNREACKQERSLSDYLYRVIRHHLYGAIVTLDTPSVQSISSDKVHRD